MNYLYDLVIVLGSATLVAVFFHFIKFPPVIGFITTGAILGPFGLKLIGTEIEIEVLTEIAAVLLMFTIGLEFSFAKLARYRKMFVWLGLGQIILTFSITMACAHQFFNLDWREAAVWGAMIALSSTAMVLKLIKDHRDEATPFGQAGISILLFQDIAVIPMILLLPLLSRGTEGKGMELLPFFILLLAIPFIFVSTKFVVPFLLKVSIKTKSREVFFFTIIFVALGSSLVMHELGLSLSLGAFVAGMLISESPYSHHASSMIEPLRDHFLSLFFIVLGMTLNISFLWANIVPVVGISLLVMLGKLAVIFLLIWILARSFPLGLATGLLLCQVGEFSIILSGQALALDLIPVSQRQYFLSIAIFTLILTPLIYGLAPKAAWSFSKLPFIFKKMAIMTKMRELLVRLELAEIAPKKDEMKDHTVIIGFGAAGKNLASVLKNLELPYHIIEFNSTTVQKYKDEEPIDFGDATRPELLRKAGIEKAKIVIIAISGTHLVKRIISSIRSINSDIPVLVRSHYLRELETLKGLENIEFVVGEAETALQLVSKVLSCYGVHESSIAEYRKASRQSLCESKACVEGLDSLITNSDQE